MFECSSWGSQTQNPVRRGFVGFWLLFPLAKSVDYVSFSVGYRIQFWNRVFLFSFSPNPLDFHPPVPSSFLAYRTAQLSTASVCTDWPRYVVYWEPNFSVLAVSECLITGWNNDFLFRSIGVFVSLYMPFVVALWPFWPCLLLLPPYNYIHRVTLLFCYRVLICLTDSSDGELGFFSSSLLCRRKVTLWY